jgi:hypothetical protein
MAGVNFQEIPPMEAEIQPKSISRRVMSLSLFIDGNQIYAVCTACVESATYHVSGKYL